MIPRNMAFLFGTLLIGCGEVPLDSKEPSGEVLTEDADGDGVSEEEGDCDDSNPNISPSATDLVGDEIDQNCDGVDGMDLYGDGYASVVSGGDDCDDSDPEVYPADEDGGGSTLCYEVADCDDSNADINALDADGDGPHVMRHRIAMTMMLISTLQQKKPVMKLTTTAMAKS